MKKLICRMVTVAVAAFAARVGAEDWLLTLPEETTNGAVTVISDGNWKINVHIRNAETRELGLGTKSGARNALVIENNKVVGSGDLDFRKPVYQSGNRWVITSPGTSSFANGGVPAENLYFPAEITDLGTTIFSSTYKNTSGIVSIVSTNTISILPNNMFMSCSISGVLLQLPNLKAIGGYGLDGNFLAGTDVSAWDLSSVENICVNWNNDTDWLGDADLFKANLTFFRHKKFSGTLRLPSLHVLKRQVFEGCSNMNALEAGANLTLKSAETNTVAGCTSLGSIMLGGAFPSWTIAENAFNAPNITNVTFLSYPGVLAKTGPVFGTAETPARSIVFCIPKNRKYDNYWMPHKLAARALTESELAAFTAKYGLQLAKNVIGIVPAAAFHTAQEQYLAYYEPVRPKLSVVVNDPRWNDSFTISPEPDADGAYAYGTQVTVTPIGADDRTTFGRWYGAPEGTETNSPLIFAVTDNTNLRAVFHHGWTFETDETEVKKGTMGTISNGIWKLNVYVANVAENDCRLYIGNQYVGWESARVDGCGWTGVGFGELDLNGVVSQYDADGNLVRNWTITGIASGALKMNDDVKAYTRTNGLLEQASWPTSIILPETLTTWGMQPLRSGYWSQTLSSLVMRFPNYKGEIGYDNLVIHYYDNLEIEVPRMTSLGGGSFETRSTVDVTSWRLDALTSSSAFQGRKFSGVLNLPSLSAITDKMFQNCSNMNGIDLGSNTVVKTIGAQAFSNCASLVRLQISSDKDLQVAADAFADVSNLKAIEFGCSPCPTDTTVIDNILAGVPDSFSATELPCVIYASRFRDWGKVATTPTDEEMKYAPPVAKASDLMGVYQTAGGARKAWLVHVPSENDPKGTLLIIR